MARSSEVEHFLEGFGAIFPEQIVYQAPTPKCKNVENVIYKVT